MIDNAGLRKYIKTQVMRNKAQKTGDTNLKKDFAGGYVSISSANNHKALRQVDLQYGFFDDFESVKSASKESGSTRKLLEQRFAAYADQMKMFLISTPERMEESNIYEAYLLGDQRKYHVPCPCCGEMIVLEWSVEVELDGQKVSAGITWKVDENNKLVKGSVGYTCQKCGDFFTENHKQQIMSEGRYLPTATPSREGFFSYHVPSLYAYVGMFDWQHYVEDYIEANPAGQQTKEPLLPAFTHRSPGWPYHSASEDLKATLIMANLRNYDINTLPEKQSIKDGNGKIVLVTCAADLNGKVEDARVDYEIVAWSESGSSYSIRHGSIGTFIPLEGYKKVKERRQFQLSQGYVDSGIVLMYISDGQSVDAASQIDVQAISCAMAWQAWKSDPQQCSIDNSPKGRTFYNRKSNLRSRLSELTLVDIREVMRQNYTAAIKQ